MVEEIGRSNREKFGTSTLYYPYPLVFFLYILLSLKAGFHGGSVVKCPLGKQETRVQSLGWEDPLEKEMATRSSILAWRIPGTGEPGRL